VVNVSILSIFSIVYVGIFGKKYSFALHLVKMNADPDPQALDDDPDPKKMVKNSLTYLKKFIINIFKNIFCIFLINESRKVLKITASFWTIPCAAEFRTPLRFA
jgi:hypothetical protein